MESLFPGTMPECPGRGRIYMPISEAGKKGALSSYTYFLKWEVLQGSSANKHATVSGLTIPLARKICSAFGKFCSLEIACILDEGHAYHVSEKTVDP